MSEPAAPAPGSARAAVVAGVVCYVLWGFLPISYVKGRAMTIYFSYDPDATGAASLLTSIRWGRLFRQVH